MRRHTWTLALAVAAWALGTAFAGAFPRQDQKADASETQVTFNRDIAPIIFSSCASCHRPGEAAPFSLLTYEDVKKHARQIADVMRTRNMPPWLPEPQQLKFADEMRLPAAQIDLIQRWVDQGEQAGNPADRAAEAKVRRGMATGDAGSHSESRKAVSPSPGGYGHLLEFYLPPANSGNALGQSNRNSARR